MGELQQTLKDVTDGIRAQSARFTLSLLAITIGIIALTLLISVLNALQDRSEQLLQELGANVVAVISDSPATASEGLSLRHADLLVQNFPELAVSTVGRYQVPTLGTRKKLTVVATDQTLMGIRQWQLLEGRFLDATDVLNAERHAVISKSLSEQWNWRPGSIIYLRETPFTIVGIVDVGGQNLDRENSDGRLMLGERVVLVPKTVIPYWATQLKYRQDKVDAIFIQGETSANSTLTAVRSVLQQPGMRAGKLSWVTPESLIQNISKLQKTIRLTAGTIALLCLVLGGTTLMSLMVANVRERITEIGLRRALGASQWDIATLFVAEAVLITLIAGLLGTLIAHVLLGISADTLPVPTSPGWSSVLMPPLVAILLGALLSYWPARMAARITPSEALRDE
jgi:putative ABC transport system permease protein